MQTHRHKKPKHQTKYELDTREFPDTIVSQKICVTKLILITWCKCNHFEANCFFASFRLNNVITKLSCNWKLVANCAQQSNYSINICQKHSKNLQIRIMVFCVSRVATATYGYVLMRQLHCWLTKLYGDSAKNGCVQDPVAEQETNVKLVTSLML